MEPSSSPRFREPGARGGASTGGGGAQGAGLSRPRLLVSARAAGALLVSGCQAAETEERPEEVTTVEVRVSVMPAVAA